MSVRCLAGCYSFARHGANYRPGRTIGRSRQQHYSFSTVSSQSFSNLLTWYSIKLETNPLLTKGITAGLIAALGDFSCQVLVASPKDNDAATSSTANLQSFWDPLRTARFGFLGTVLVAPIIHYWYGALATQILPGTTLRTILQRVALDQFVFTPLFLPLWLVSLWKLEEYPQPIQQSEHDTISSSSIDRQVTIATYSSRLQNSLPTMLLANWGLWIPAQAINFRYVPTKYQVLYSNIVGLAWNTYLSFATRQRQPPQTERKKCPFAKV